MSKDGESIRGGNRTPSINVTDRTRNRGRLLTWVAGLSLIVAILLRLGRLLLLTGLTAWLGATRRELGRSGGLRQVSGAAAPSDIRPAQRLLEQAADRVSRLQALTAAFSEAITPTQVATVVIEQGVTALGANAGTLALLDVEGTNLKLFRSIGYTPDVVEQWYQFPVTIPTPLSDTAQTGEPIFIGRAQDLIQRYPRPVQRKLFPHEALAAVPLLVEGRILGGLGLSFAQPQTFSQEDQTFILALARQCAQALERARLYAEAQAELAARQQTEKQLQALLQEKEILLREIHHRVKNNLQAISNLLSMQASYLDDDRVRQMFRETQNRVKSIALIHEKLYLSNDLAQIDFSEYIQNLAHYLLESSGVDPASIVLNIQVDNVTIDIDTAVPVGIIINELVSNSLQYAFPPHEPGQPAGRASEILIELSRQPESNLFLLRVSDNGVGLPEDALTGGSLGLQLVRLLSHHLKGTLQLDRSAGTTVQIIFPPLSPVLDQVQADLAPRQN